MSYDPEPSLQMQSSLDGVDRIIHVLLPALLTVGADRFRSPASRDSPLLAGESLRKGYMPLSGTYSVAFSRFEMKNVWFYIESNLMRAALGITPNELARIMFDYALG